MRPPQLPAQRLGLSQVTGETGCGKPSAVARIPSNFHELLHTKHHLPVVILDESHSIAASIFESLRVFSPLRWTANPWVFCWSRSARNPFYHTLDHLRSYLPARLDLRLPPPYRLSPEDPSIRHRVQLVEYKPVCFSPRMPWPEFTIILKGFIMMDSRVWVHYSGKFGSTYYHLCEIGSKAAHSGL